MQAVRYRSQHALAGCIRDQSNDHFVMLFTLCSSPPLLAIFRTPPWVLLRIGLTVRNGQAGWLLSSDQVNCSRKMIGQVLGRAALSHLHYPLWSQQRGVTTSGAGRGQWDQCTWEP